MPRYFQSHVTGRALMVGDRSFLFEPVEPMGGSWLGVLAVDDESAANILATSDAAWEITEEKFDTLKKKRSGAATVPGFAQSQTPQLPAQPMVAASPADRLSSSSFSAAPAAAAVAVVPPSITLLTTSRTPPPEPLLEVMQSKRRKAA